MPTPPAPAASSHVPTPPLANQSVIGIDVLLRTMPWAVLTLAPDGTVTALTPSAEALWGLPAAAILGRPPAQVQPAVLPPALLQALAAPPPPAEYWLPHTQQWIAMRTALTREGHTWVYWDNITVAKQAEQQQAQQHRISYLLTAVEEVAHAGSYEAELASMSFLFSDGLFRLFGEAPQSFIPSLEFIDSRSHPDDISTVRLVLNEAVAENKPYHYVRRIYRTDGQLRTLEAFGNVISDASGTPVKLLGLVQDVTERKLAEAEVLRVKEELTQRATDQYQALFQAIDEGYFLAEVEFDQQGQPVDILYLDANPAATRMVGQDFTGRRLKEINPDYEAYWYDIFGRVARTGVSERQELHAAPDHKWYDFYVSKVGSEPSRRVAVVFQDVTERKRRAAHAAFLAGIQDDLSRLTTADEIMQTVGAKIGAYLRLASCSFIDIDESREDDMLVRYSWASKGAKNLLGRYRSRDFISQELVRMSRAGQPTILRDTRVDARTDAYAHAYAELGIGAFVGFPFHRHGEWKHIFSVSDTKPRDWLADELDLLDELSRRLFPRLERAHTEEALRQSEANFRTLFETMEEGFSVCELLRDANGRAIDCRFLELNPAFEKLTGLNRATAVGRLSGEVLPGVDAWWIRTYEQVVDTGEPIRFEHYLGLLNRWYDVTVFGYGSERFAVLYDDISVRKMVEQGAAADKAWLEQQVVERTQALQASKEMLQSIHDTSLVGMSVLRAVRDADGTLQDFTIVLVNRELERETGRTDLVGKLYAQEYPGIIVTGLFEFMRQAVETGEPQHTEFFYPHEGFSQWFSCTFCKLGDGLVATNLNITERKVAEEKRFEQLVLLQQAEDVALLGSWEYHLATGAYSWSAGMYRLFGLPPGHVSNPEAYLHQAIAEDQPKAETLVRQMRAGQESLEQTLRIQVGNEVRTLKIKGALARNEQGEPVKMLGVDLDVTDLARLEAENLRMRLQQQQDLFNAVLETQETERRRIAESLHNGLGQTLYATKLRLGQLRPLAPEAWSSTDALLADAIRQTRTLSHELVPAVLLEFGLQAALHDICHKISSRQLRFHCSVVLGEAPLSRPLQVALYRMAQELAQNIVKHAHATEASLALEIVPGFVLLRAEDNGVGFASTTEPSTGLGLRTIHDRVVLLGGTVDIGSSPQFGTYVRIRFPLPSPGTPGV